MQCQICNKNDATIHLTEIADGVRTEMHICEQCAIEQDIAVKSHIPINELLSNLLAVQPSDDELFGPSEQKLACPNCGFTLEQFRKEGALGCPRDYEVLRKHFLPSSKKRTMERQLTAAKSRRQRPGTRKSRWSFSTFVSN